MPFLPALAVVFVGILGGAHSRAEHQVTALLKHLAIESIKLPSPQLKALIHHDPETRELVQGLHADGVVGFEVRDNTLRLVTYDGDGKLRTYLDTPIGRSGLDGDDLETLRETLEADVGALRHEPAPAEPAIEIDPPAPATHDPAPVATAEATDSVSADEVEALVSGGSVATASAPTPVEHTIGIGASLGVGVTGRNFQPAIATVPAYYSAAVGMIHVDGHIAPTAPLDLAVMAERTLEMTSPVHEGMAATTISRWEASASYALTRGAIAISPRLGFGRRTFAIDSIDPARAPDGEYGYLIVGAGVRADLTSYLALQGVALFEPVVAGAESTEMAFGEASRWAVDVGLAVEVHRGHLFARCAAEYQRFWWSWGDAGARGGDATDAYPSGTLAFGAAY